MHRPNNLVESDAREAMDYDPRLDDSRIVAKASHGRVTLNGTVDTYPKWNGLPGTSTTSWVSRPSTISSWLVSS